MRDVYLSRDPRARRRFAALLAVAAAATVGGVVVGAGGEPSDPAPQARTQRAQPAATAQPQTPRLSLRKRVGELVVMRFAGTEAPRYVLSALRRGRSPGVILFKDNIASPQALRQMTGRLHRAAGGTAIVATDQEGGSIRNLEWAAPAASQGATSTPDAAAVASRDAARDLLAHGINMNLAPVADVASVAGSVMAGRAYPGDAPAVADIVGASVRAYRGTGVVPVVKHFPGIGAATENTDDGAVTIERTAEQLAGDDLPPFSAAIDAGVPVVMASHAVYPVIDDGAVASQSAEVLEGLLRRRMGFEGVIITDSVEAAAISDRMTPEQAAIRSIRAGVDLILTTGPGSHIRSYRALMAEARRSPEFERRVTEAAGRVLALREQLQPK
jgi:beta-N-acetylhexosaminidase